MFLKYKNQWHNSGAVANSKEPRSHKRGKHIERGCHLVREIVHRGDIVMSKIDTAENFAEPFTKALATKVFEGYLKDMGMQNMSHML